MHRRDTEGMGMGDSLQKHTQPHDSWLLWQGAMLNSRYLGRKHLPYSSLLSKRVLEQFPRWSSKSVSSEIFLQLPLLLSHILVLSYQPSPCPIYIPCLVHSQGPPCLRQRHRRAQMPQPPQQQSFLLLFIFIGN